MLNDLPQVTLLLSAAKELPDHPGRSPTPHPQPRCAVCDAPMLGGEAGGRFRGSSSSLLQFGSSLLQISGEEKPFSFP